MTEKLVTIKEFSTPFEAYMWKSLLAENGIESFLADEFVPLWSRPLGVNIFNVKLQVRESDLDMAMKILKGELPEETDTPDDPNPS